MTTSTYTQRKKAWIADYESAYLERFLKESGGSVTKAARAAGLDRSNFLRLLRKYNIKSATFRVQS